MFRVGCRAEAWGPSQHGPVVCADCDFVSCTSRTEGRRGLPAICGSGDLPWASRSEADLGRPVLSELVSVAPRSRGGERWESACEWLCAPLVQTRPQPVPRLVTIREGEPCGVARETWCEHRCLRLWGSHVSRGSRFARALSQELGGALCTEGGGQEWPC